MKGEAALLVISFLLVLCWVYSPPLKMKAVDFSESSANSTILHGITSQDTGLFKIISRLQHNLFLNIFL
jgi:hypothetical protein